MNFISNFKRLLAIAGLLDTFILLQTDCIFITDQWTHRWIRNSNERNRWHFRRDLVVTKVSTDKSRKIRFVSIRNSSVKILNSKKFAIFRNRQDSIYEVVLYFARHSYSAVWAMPPVITVGMKYKHYVVLRLIHEANEHNRSHFVLCVVIIVFNAQHYNSSMVYTAECKYPRSKLRFRNEWLTII